MSAPPPTPAGHSLVLDTSRIQSGFPWRAAVDAGAVAVICKSTEGETYDDQAWQASTRGAAEAGLMVGSYHVYRPEHPDPAVQARHYYETAHASTMLCPIIDFELLNGVSPELAAVGAMRFVEASAKLWGKRHGLVYASPSFLAACCATDVGRCAIGRMASLWGLWLADYRKTPTLPPQWPAYTGWQFSGGANAIAGTPVDCSWFVGVARDVAALGASAV